MSGLSQAVFGIVRSSGCGICLSDIRGRLRDDGIRADVVTLLLTLLRLEREGMVRFHVDREGRGLDRLVFSMRTGRRRHDGRSDPVRLSFA